jgi:hypothetical protein
VGLRLASTLQCPGPVRHSVRARFRTRCGRGASATGDTGPMTLPQTHVCNSCSDDPVSGVTVHEDLVLGAPLSMEDLDEAQRLARFAGKYVHDGCRVTEVRRAPAEGVRGYAWLVRFTEEAALG